MRAYLGTSQDESEISSFLMCNKTILLLKKRMRHLFTIMLECSYNKIITNMRWYSKKRVFCEKILMRTSTNIIGYSRIRIA